MLIIGQRTYLRLSSDEIKLQEKFIGHCKKSLETPVKFLKIRMLRALPRSRDLDGIGPGAGSGHWVFSKINIV